MQPKILLSEGTSLSAREAINTLGLSGRVVDVCAPTLVPGRLLEIGAARSPDARGRGRPWRICAGREEPVSACSVTWENPVPAISSRSSEAAIL